MSDFETLLRDSLSAAAGGSASDVTGLAAGAGLRARDRRRRTTIVGVLAIVLVVLPIGVLLSRDGGGRSTPPIATDSARGLPDGWRVETWRDLTLRVPASWGYGTLDQWCADSGDDAGGPTVSGGDPVVDRPGAQTDVLCSPRAGFGVRFRDPREQPHFPVANGEVVRYEASGDQAAYPSGSWLGYYRIAGHAAIEIVAPDEETARRIQDSASRAAVDDNGCQTSLDAALAKAVPSNRNDRLSVCRYGPEGWLEQSERLSADASASALKAVEEAPVRTEVETCAGLRRYGSVELTSGSALGTVTVVWDSNCAGDNGVFGSGTVKELTPDVLYWAISPGWSGGWDPKQVPMPKEFRRLPGH